MLKCPTCQKTHEGMVTCCGVELSAVHAVAGGVRVAATPTHAPGRLGSPADSSTHPASTSTEPTSKVQLVEQGAKGGGRPAIAPTPKEGESATDTLFDDIGRGDDGGKSSR